MFNQHQVLGKAVENITVNERDKNPALVEQEVATQTTNKYMSPMVHVSEMDSGWR